MLFIYTPKVTNRIKFVLDFVFQQYFDIPYQLLTSLPNTTENCIFYTNKFNKGFSIYQHHLLLEETIKQQDLSIQFFNELPTLFQSTTTNATIPFDIFSVIFFLISRYEEYLPHQKDEHGRYLSSNSILNHDAFQFRPIVEEWLIHLKAQLLIHFPSLIFKEHQFKIKLTFDIDNAFAYKGRNFKDFSKLILKPTQIFEKYSVIKNLKQDPFYTFDDFLPLLKQYKQQVLFFFLLSNQHKKDSVVNPKHILLKQLIQKIEHDFEIGIHPSYAVLENKSIVAEKELLEKYTSKKIVKVRQHFLRIHFPNTFQTYIEAGLTEDYSLAYPNVSGCRAGTTQAFYFFDLTTNESTALKIYPFIWMDATYQYYQTNNEEVIWSVFDKIFQDIKKIKGNFVALFHNDLLQNELIVFKNIFKYLIKNEN